MASKTRIGSKQCGSVTIGSTTFYFSYRTCIGFRQPGNNGIFDERKYSVTTSRHRNGFMMPGDVLVSPQDFDRMLEGASRQVGKWPTADFSR